MNPDQLARACADAMYGNDLASQDLGMVIDDITEGRAVMSMTVRDNMLNGHEVCHGGFIFALADSAFAFACNSQNVGTLAQGARIDFLAPGRPGDRLTATACQVSQGGRTGIYDVTVVNQEGKTLAIFRGNSYRVGGEVLDLGKGETNSD